MIVLWSVVTGVDVAGQSVCGVVCLGVFWCPWSHSVGLEMGVWVKYIHL